MFEQIRILTIGLLALLLSGMAIAGGLGDSWQFSSDNSKVAFGSIKKDPAGESHRFNSISGTMDDYGKVMISIELASVDTGIEVRDTRITDNVFNAVGPSSSLEAQVNPASISAMEPGAMTTMDVTGKVTLGDSSLDISTPMFVVKLSADRFIASTDEMIMIPTEALGVNAGVDKLMELAQLPSITRVTPETLRLVFDRQQ